MNKITKKEIQKQENSLDNELSMNNEQENGSIYYTQNQKIKLKEKQNLVENDNQENMNKMDCSFDNSIVPIASSSSLSSQRSSINSANFTLDDYKAKKYSQEKKKFNKDAKEEKIFHQNFSSNDCQINQRELENIIHTDECNEKLPNVAQINKMELNSSSCNDQYKLQGLSNQDKDCVINQAKNNLEPIEIRNSISNSDDDSLPYFQQTLSFNQEICYKLRWKLKYYFMNPIEKWKAKKKFPWKLILQVIKIIFVTIHVLLYGNEMSRFLNHEGNMLISFRELLLNNWDPVREVMAYPPAAGPYAVYTKSDFFQNFDFAVKSFSKITKQATGSFGYSTNSTEEVSPIEVCKHYVNGTMDPQNFFYDYNNEIKKECFIIPPMGTAGDEKWDNFSFESFLKKENIDLNFNRVTKVILKFQLRTIYLNSLNVGSYPECYDVYIKINYDNSQHDGQILINLKAKSILRECKGNLIDKVGFKLHKIERSFLRLLVILLCLISLTLCSRSLIKSHNLGLETKDFFKVHFHRHLSLEDQLEFYDFWIFMIILNDILIIIGTTLLQFTHNNTSNFDYTTCTMFLGIGIFLVWTGILRYLSFFKKYNVVILTAKRALPDIFRFLLCVLLLYGAFCLCGWIVLGPYHLKFRTLSKTSECLFSLLNGDDMFATFATTDTNDHVIWLFSRVYLYGFITIFIYIILSLFISIIMDAYETIKECYANGLPLSDLHKFISECNSNPPEFLSNQHNAQSFSFKACFTSCCHCTETSTYEGL